MADNTNAFSSDSERSADFTPFLNGQIIGGKYKIIDLIASGGMGTVYKVTQVFLLKEFALKTLDKRSITDTTLRRFQLEAKAASSLSHPNLVQVHDFGLLDDGQPYLVMDLIDGIALSKLIKEVGQLEIEKTLSIIAQVCLGLAHAHDQGVIHRDLKPGNIMLAENTQLGEEGSVKIVDFGIAKIVSNDDEEIQNLTNTGEVFGSPFYMSPEQCLGGKIDHRTDIYSLGCVLYECLTGAPPHIGQNALRTMMLHETAPLVSLKQATLGKEFPEALESIVAKMLAKSPAERYQNLGLVAHDLSSVSRKEPVVFIADKPRDKTKRPRKSITLEVRQFAGILALTAIFSSGLVGIAIRQIRNFGAELQSDQRRHSENSSKQTIAPQLDSTDSIENDIREHEEKIKKAIESARRIEPRIVIENGSRKKELLFPDCKIGSVCFDDQSKDARGRVLVPVDSDLRLILNEWASEKLLLAMPLFFRKIDPSAFRSLSLADVANDPTPGDVTRMPEADQKLDEILDIISRWTNLQSLRLQNLSLGPRELNQIRKSSSLVSLHLIESTISSSAQPDDAIYLKTKKLEIKDIVASSIAIRNILKNASCLEDLEIKDMHIEPGTLIELKHFRICIDLAFDLKIPNCQNWSEK